MRYFISITEMAEQSGVSSGQLWTFSVAPKQDRQGTYVEFMSSKRKVKLKGALASFVDVSQDDF